ncbi:MAG TPA: hypothetical protein DCS07_11675 [Bdellovibrionales bacterium]|nr:MAG: hypothetical protein A2Z97_13870 [Bdellovibrionales bacterium GWB1_52_6]OFZ06390.1 MAG: hypothetical protein A2X97_02920 [Bdellovibrionales bacterium GWA1_52_35]OFZ39961.1 MAG: hypothetical protein A2070_07925 [Bdellovibrionales bacterium GWC1_52_8]HAR43267.1 hypothetical protein [Bdellovibrionales bacterium]HCM40145.1 hypothetical protein [Bdellovibrionales bacterium]
MPKEQLFKTASRLFAAALGAAALAAVGVVAAQDDNGNENGDDSPGTVATASPTATASPVSAQRQVYIAQLSPTNGSGASGTARIVVDGGNMGVSIEGAGLSPNMMHPQHIHAGTQCAGTGADTNFDGWVDVKEAEAVGGQAILPLTLNLSAQAGSTDAGSAQNFPIASESGLISYIQSAPVANFGTLPMPTMSPTESPGTIPSPTESPTESPTPTDSPSPAESPSPTGSPAETPTVTPTLTPTTEPVFTPIPTESPEILSLSNRVVQIHGLDVVSLPSTVQSDEGMAANSTLPVACGTLVRVTE